MAVDDTRGRVQATISDLWGRWTALELQARGGRKMLFITAYQVCAAPTNTRGSTAYHQQEAMARLARRPIENPRYNFQHDLRQFILEKNNISTPLSWAGILMNPLPNLGLACAPWRSSAS
jgi:hypothetical protein